MIDARHPAGQPFFYEGNDTGVLLIHGFTGTCGQMRPLGEALRGAGYTVMAPLLPGHGTSLEDMSRTSGGDWLHCVRDAYVSLEKMVERVVVCGLSMGGTLATILAEEYNPVGLATLSGAIRVREKFAWGGGRAVALEALSALDKPGARWRLRQFGGRLLRRLARAQGGRPQPPARAGAAQSGADRLSGAGGAAHERRNGRSRERAHPNAGHPLAAKEACDAGKFAACVYARARSGKRFSAK